MFSNGLIDGNIVVRIFGNGCVANPLTCANDTLNNKISSFISLILDVVFTLLFRLALGMKVFVTWFDGSETNTQKTLLFFVSVLILFSPVNSRV